MNFYWEYLKTKKVNIFIALLALFIFALIMAWALTAQALVGVDVGLKINSMPMKCMLDPGSPPPGTCLNTCASCGQIKDVCASLYEVKATKLSGAKANPLKNAAALCLYNPKPPKGGMFRPGGFCLGKVIGVGPHMLLNFGCSR